MKNVSLVGIFSNGLMVAFDDNGDQISELQKFSVVDILEEKFNSLGYTLVDSEFSMSPSGGFKATKSSDGTCMYLIKD